MGFIKFEREGFPKRQVLASAVETGRLNINVLSSVLGSTVTLTVRGNPPLAILELVGKSLRGRGLPRLNTYSTSAASRCQRNRLDRDRSASRTLVGTPRQRFGSSRSCAHHRRRPTTKTNGWMAARSDASRHQQSGLVLSSSQGDTDRLVVSAITDPAAAEQTSQPSRCFLTKVLAGAQNQPVMGA